MQRLLLLFAAIALTASTEVNAGTIERIGGMASKYDVSYDGRFIVTIEEGKVYLQDRQEQKIKPLNFTTAGDREYLGVSDVHVSGDGQYVVFSALAKNMRSNLNECVIATYSTETGAYQVPYWEQPIFTGWGPTCSIQGISPSADAKNIAFSSWRDRIVPGDTDGYSDIFIIETSSGTIESLPDKVAAGGDVVIDSDPKISADGSKVIFHRKTLKENEQWFRNLDDTVMYERGSRSLRIESPNRSSYSNSHTISGDGSHVSFLAFYQHKSKPFWQEIRLNSTSSGKSITVSESGGQPSLSFDAGIVTWAERYITPAGLEKFSINIFRADSGTIETIVDDVGFGSQAIISGNGKHVLFTSSNPGIIFDAVSPPGTYLLDLP